MEKLIFWLKSEERYERVYEELEGRLQNIKLKADFKQKSEKNIENHALLDIT